MIKKKAMELVKALRSGEYEQGKYFLVNDRDMFCCLGVACNISKQPLEWKQLEGNKWYIGDRYNVLPYEIQEEFGFYNFTGYRSDFAPIKIGDKEYLSLTNANDNGATFEQIADYIEENWEKL